MPQGRMPERSGTSTPAGDVVLVHGIFDTGRVFRKMSDALQAHGFRCWTPDLTPNSGVLGLEQLAAQLDAYIERYLDSGEQFSMVGFSMGGLVCRYYLQHLGGIRRASKLVTLSTPHHGSLLAHALRHKGAMQLRPGSDFLIDLQQGAHLLESIATVSIWTPFDLMIVPAVSSRMPSWKEIRLSVLLHPWMLSDRTSVDAVIRELKEA